MATGVRSSSVQRFDGFEVDPRARELRRNGTRVRMQDQPLEVLLLLLARKGEVVTREELKQRLWPADTFVDSDDGLNTAIRKLREILGDSPEKPVYIETIPRRGYRFLVEVQEEEEKPLETPVAETAPASTSGGDSRPAHRRWLAGAAVAVVIVAAAAAAWFWYQDRPAPVRSVAVLPFANLSGDPSQDYFADAMTEEMTTDLATIGALRVISRTSAMHYKGTNRTVPEIARELNVDSVIEGSVLRTGDRVRITAQLIDAHSDLHLWSASYERDLKDVLTLQSELAHTIAGEVRAAVSPEEEQRLHAGPVNPQAYEAYLRGRSNVDNWTTESSAEALHFFERAVELDPNYALAWVGMAECYWYGVAGVGGDEAAKRGFAAANRALDLKPNMGEAHVMLGMLRLNHWDFAGAEAEIRKGLALAPNYAVGHHWYSHFLMYVGRYDEAMVETKKLMELDPVSSTPVGHLAFQYRVMRQWDLAIAQYKKALAMEPTQVDLHAELGETYAAKHEYREAIAELSRAVEMERFGEQYPHYLAMLGFARAQAGDIAGARKILAELPANDPFDAAYVDAGLGDRDNSIALLNEAWQKHTLSLEAGYVVELDPLRSDPRFTELLQRAGLR